MTVLKGAKMFAAMIAAILFIEVASGETTALFEDKCFADKFVLSRLKGLTDTGDSLSC